MKSKQVNSESPLEQLKRLLPRIPREGMGIYATTRANAEKIIQQGFNDTVIRVHIIPGSLDPVWALHSDNEKARRIDNTLLTAVVHAMANVERSKAPRLTDWSKISSEQYPVLIFLKGIRGQGSGGLVFITGHDREILQDKLTYGLNVKSNLPRTAIASVSSFTEKQHENAVKNAKDSFHLVDLVSRKLHREARQTLFKLLRPKKPIPE